MVFREVKRVLRDDGTLWLNLGDSYYGGKGSNGNSKARRTASERGYLQSPGTVMMDTRPLDLPQEGLKPKDLVGIPWRVAFALQADGWWLRSDIIWGKPNPMPESVKDRPTRAHEYIFLLTKSQRYFYDHMAVQEDCANGDPTSPRGSKGVLGSPNAGNRFRGTKYPGVEGKATYSGNVYTPLAKRNMRDVIFLPTKGFKCAHFAVFPESLVEPLIRAGTSEKGCCPKCGSPFVRITEKQTAPVTNPIPFSKPGNVDRNDVGNIYEETVVRTIGWKPSCQCGLDPVPCVTLDPFGGSGTVAKVSRDLGRKTVYIDLNPQYVDMAEKRIGTSLFNTLERKVI